MTWQFNPYAIPLLAASAAMLALTVVTSRYKTQAPAQFFLLIMVSVTCLMIFSTLELLSASVSQMLLWIKFEYIFSVSIPVLFLLFILSYNHYDAWLTRPRVLALFGIPALHLVAVWTNEYFGLNWQSVGIKYIGSIAIFDRTYGPVFWIGISYLYLLVITGTGVLIVTTFRASNVYRRQLIPLILSVALIWITNILTILHVSQFDLTPFGYALMCCLIAWSLFRFKLFDIMPAAHRAVIQQMSDSIIVVDAQQRIVELNPAAEKLLARSAREIIGQDAHVALASIPELVTNDGQSESRRQITLSRNGELYYFDRRFSPLSDKQGNLTGQVIVLRDITRLKQAEEASRRYAAELERRNNELDAFSHTIAHDLKAPLTLVGGYAEIILARECEGMSPGALAHLTAIRNSATKMNDMVNDLLLLSSTMNVEELITEVNMQQVAAAALERFRSQLDQNKFRVEIATDLPPALGYPLWVEEVFANLVGNSIKYIGKNNPNPCIAICGSQHGNMARYEVYDNGLGINTEDQQRLFQAFARFHKNEASGVGLGLTIVMRIVTRLNGQVGVESTPGKGSKFWFSLPIAPVKIREAEMALVHKWSSR